MRVCRENTNPPLATHFAPAVGRSSADSEYFTGSIAWLYVVAAVVSDAEIATIVASMYRGDDVLQACESCLANIASAEKSYPCSYRLSVPEDVNDRAIAFVPGLAQFATLANRNTPPVYTMTGTMHGWAIGSDNPGIIAWRLRTGVYVFVLHQGHVKMSTVSLLPALISSTPASPGDRYILSQSAPFPTTLQMVQDMWDKTFPGETTIFNGDDPYEVKNVVVVCAGLCSNIGFDNTGGPHRGGVVTFERTQSQFRNAGLRTLNIATNGGFTAVAVIMFTGGPASWERVIDFGNGPGLQNLLIARVGNSANLVF